jgi:hypothetical protein
MLSLNDPRLPTSPGKKSLLALTAAVFGCMLCMFCSFVALTINSSQAGPGQVADARPTAASAATGDGAVVLAQPSATPGDTTTPTQTSTEAAPATDTETPTPESASTPTPTQTQAPSATFSATPTPSNTPTNTPTRTPSATPSVTSTPTNTPTATATPAVSFAASPNPLERSQCTTVRWDVDNVQAVYIFGGQWGASAVRVPNHSYQSACPSADTAYTLRIVIASGTRDYPLTVRVVDTTAPPMPVPYAPNGSTCLDCTSPPPSSPTFQWGGVSDASGNLRYEWRLYTYGGGCQFCTVYNLVTTGTSTSTSAPWSGVYRNVDYFWQVRAMDGAGSAGPYSALMQFKLWCNCLN